MNNYQEIEMTVDEFKNILENENGIFEIETPNGWIRINEFYNRGVRQCVEFKAEDKSIICSYDHLFLGENEWKQANDFKIGDIVKTKDGDKYVTCINTVKNQQVYDLWINSAEHAYYSNDIISHNCGKTEFVHELAKEFGCKVFQINGSEGLTNADFYGNMSVAVDEKTSQNYTFFEKGALYRAFIEGTKLDADGNQILDANGEPIVVGNPAFFFLDEFAAMLPEVFLGVFNRAMEIPRENGKGRSIEIPMDNGRVVKSHPSMVMFFAGNTVGTGNNGRYQMGFTAQGNKMDESTRNRITAYFHFGYSKSAEESIVTAMLNDDCETEKLLSFRDNVRNLFRNEKVETLFTTRSIVATCNMAKCFRDNGKSNWLADAIRVAVFNGLPETDKPAFNETIRMIWGVDIMAEESRKTDYDYI